ncbi:MAG: class C sortase [bacterium]
MVRKIIRVFMVLVLLVGIAIIGYPSFANWWNQQQQNGAIVRYTRMVEAMEPEEVVKMREEAHAYNASHPVQPAVEMEGEARKTYNSVLDVSGTGIMGYVEIPKIGVNLPIYHGTSESVLQIAVGHLEGTSFPVGGAGTHCVLTGHTGLPSAELFTRIDELREGDQFSLAVLGENLLYQIDQIEVVLPMELNLLAAVQGEDYCTLVTCTPYGINSHRLLVRGRRVAVEEEPEIEDPIKKAERARLIQQLRSADMRYIKSGFFDRAAEMLPIIALLGALACIIHFLRRKRRWEKWKSKDGGGSSGPEGKEGHPKVLERFVPPAGSRDRGRDWWTGDESKNKKT